LIQIFLKPVIPSLYSAVKPPLAVRHSERSEPKLVSAPENSPELESKDLARTANNMRKHRSHLFSRGRSVFSVKATCGYRLMNTTQPILSA
jgi:hypothetical protein